MDNLSAKARLRGFHNADDNFSRIIFFVILLCLLVIEQYI